MAKSSTKPTTVPPRRRCGAMEAHNRLIEQHPSFRTALGEIEHLTQARMAAPFTAKTTGPVHINVVVHVVHNTAVENISDAQVKSQLKALNRDYRAQNADKKK